MEDLDGLDEVVGGEDGEDGVRVGLGEHGRGEAHGVERVAGDGLAEEAFAGEVGQGGLDLLAVAFAGADVLVGIGDDAGDAFCGDVQE